MTERADYYASLPGVEIGTPLTCGCCGAYFETWEGYQNQDQDAGFGVCSSCQKAADHRNEAEWDKLETLVAKSLNDANREKFLKLDLPLRRGIILEMIDEGLVTWGFGP